MGVLSIAIQRGTICNNRFNPSKEVLCGEEPIDGHAPFSGADKARIEAAMSRNTWVEWTPLEKRFHGVPAPVETTSHRGRPSPRTPQRDWMGRPNAQNIKSIKTQLTIQSHVYDCRGRSFRPTTHVNNVGVLLMDLIDET
jgi:hypothetical protein